MMGFWTLVLIAVVLSTFATVINNWIRARHGYPLEDGQGPRSARQVAAIIAENGELKVRLGDMEQRLRVVERIATDPSEITAREIEKLRHQPDA